MLMICATGALRVYVWGFGFGWRLLDFMEVWIRLSGPL